MMFNFLASPTYQLTQFDYSHRYNLIANVAGVLENNNDNNDDNGNYEHNNNNDLLEYQ
jgi:hypothetical protein